MDQFLWFLLGAFTGFIVNLISPPVYNWIRPKIKRMILRWKSGKTKMIVLGPGLPSQKMKLGFLELDFIVLQYARYHPRLIQCTYNEKKGTLNVEIERLRTDFVKDLKRRQTRGDTGLPYNSLTYKLKKFDVSQREIIDGEEIPVLKLDFGPTDYFTEIVTDLNVGNPTREKFAQGANLTSNPVEEFASIVGINFNLITSDGYLIITKRSSRVNINGGIYHTSVAEHLLRPTDSDLNGAPDVFQCARRGSQEELGIEIAIENIEFTAFGVYPRWCQYKLIGWSQINESKDEVNEIYSLAIPKDKWENSQLIFLPCNPTAVAKFIRETDRSNWYDIGLACVILSLFQVGYSYREVNEAFA